MNLLKPTTRFLLLSLGVAFFSTQAGAQNDPAKAKVPEPEDPAVLALLETNPSTPLEWTRAASILASLDQPELAKGYLKQALEAKLSQAELVELAQQIGVPTWTELAAHKSLQPEGKLLADTVLKAVAQVRQDSNRVEQLIEQLDAPSRAQRAEAMAGLVEARTAAVGPLVKVLSDPDQVEEHARAQAVLVALGSDAVRPLLALFPEAEASLQAQVIAVLGQIETFNEPAYLVKPYLFPSSDPTVQAAAKRLLVRLLGALPTREEGLRMLTERASDYLDRGRPVGGVIDEEAEIWHWDGNKQTLRSQMVPADVAERTLAARFARDAHLLAKEDLRLSRLYLISLLEAAAYAEGLDHSLPLEHPAMEEAAQFDTGLFESALETAMTKEHPAAAAAVAQLLGQRGTDSALLHRGSRPTPLVRASYHRDRRLRMAALEAIVRLKPTKSFPGSSYITRSLGFFAASGDISRALVVSPSLSRSQTLAGMLQSLGYEADMATTGREALDRATSSPDYALVLIDVILERPPAHILLQQLRHDYRSADLRAGLIARSGHLARARQIANRDALAMAFSLPHDSDALRWQVEQLATLAPHTFVGEAQRQRQAAQSVEALVALSRLPGAPFALRRIEDELSQALGDPQRGPATTAILGKLGTASSQRTLLEVASRGPAPLVVRQAAVGALGDSIEKYGVLLRSGEILRQYDRYNQSKDFDAETQQILSTILDILEAPSEDLAPTAKIGPDGRATEKQP